MRVPAAIGTALLALACSQKRPSVPSASEAAPRPEATDSGAPVAPQPHADDAGAGNDAGAHDGAGAPDAGSAAADAGADAGTVAVTCTPGGAARLAWRIAGRNNPFRDYDSTEYIPETADDSGNVFVQQFNERGHSSSWSSLLLTRDGVTILTPGGGYDPAPGGGDWGPAYVLRAAIAYSSDGHAISYSGAELFHWNKELPDGSDAGAWVEQGPVATNGSVTMFSALKRFNESLLVAAVGADGGTLWSRVTGHATTQNVAFDDRSGIVFVEDSSTLTAVGSDGGTLYSLPSVPGYFGWYSVQASGGYLYLSDDKVYAAADGSTVTTLPGPFVHGAAILTQSQIVGYFDSTQSYVAIDLPSGVVAWQRVGSVVSAGADGVMLLLDQNGALHFVRADGTDERVCSLTLSAHYSAPQMPVLLPGNRLILQNWPDLEAWDLP